jgi:hypothetical protein
MSDIQSLIKMLQSKDHNKRYDACELLRVSPSLPLEAIDALRLTINDENPDVADAARRAIELHSIKVEENDSNKQNQFERLPLEQPQNWNSKLFLFGGVFFLMSACGYIAVIVGMVPGGLGADDVSKTLFYIPYETLLEISSFILLSFPVGAVIALLIASFMYNNDYQENANILLNLLIVIYIINFSIIMFLLWLPR